VNQTVGLNIAEKRKIVAPIGNLLPLSGCLACRLITVLTEFRLLFKLNPFLFNHSLLFGLMVKQLIIKILRNIKCVYQKTKSLFAEVETLSDLLMISILPANFVT
jgi:hypothetical protein